MKKIIIILSGGQDSTTCLYLTKRNHPEAELHTITFDYNQLHKREIGAAKIIASLANVASHEVINIPSIFDDGVIDLEKTFVPCRNMLFLTIAANRAYAIGADMIVAGIGGDSQMDFIASMAQSITAGLAKNIDIWTPLIHRNKKQTVELAQQLPGCMEALAYSHTCYAGTPLPCGTCHACLLREKGFKEAGVVDPIHGEA